MDIDGKATEEGVDRINAYFRRTADDDRADDPEHFNRLASFYAQRQGDICAKCIRTLKPEEPIWRYRASEGRTLFGGRSIGLITACEQCKSAAWQPFYKAIPCDGCTRPVHNQMRYCGPPSRTFCSQTCRDKAQAAAARDNRREARGATRRCQQCSESYEPVRSDSKFCSVACKQKAYRHRVTAGGSPLVTATQHR